VRTIGGTVLDVDNAERIAAGFAGSPAPGEFFNYKKTWFYNTNILTCMFH
jgi:hypothetical protein